MNNIEQGIATVTGIAEVNDRIIGYSDLEKSNG
jgi:hypothetical protein